jgi:NitT/TauT family transport system permease protein
VHTKRWTAAGIVFLLAAWEIAARALDSSLLLPGPLDVLAKFAALLPTEGFRLALLASLGRVLLGMIIAAPLGIACGLAAGLSKRAAAFFHPLFALISAPPVMAVILIAFLWFGSEGTPVFAAFLMLFPIMASNVMSGTASAPTDLKEVCQLYGATRRDTIRFLYLPSIAPFALSAARASLSMGWKVVAAAEVLVQPLRALGSGMQQARSQLETPELFAWTTACVIAAALTGALPDFVVYWWKRRKRGASG